MEPNSTQQHSTSGTFRRSDSAKVPVSERKPAVTRDRALAPVVAVVLVGVITALLTAIVLTVVVLG